jgi:hypothetical protein
MPNPPSRAGLHPAKRDSLAGAGTVYQFDLKQGAYLNPRPGGVHAGWIACLEGFVDSRGPAALYAGGDHPGRGSRHQWKGNG